MGRPHDAIRFAARGGMTRAQVVAAVRERDGWRCTKCGMTNDDHKRKTGRALQVHRTEPGKLYRVETCILLCRRCHGPEPRRERGAVDEEGRGGMMICLPFRYRAPLMRLKAKTGLSITKILIRAMNAYLEANGIEPPEKGASK